LLGSWISTIAKGLELPDAKDAHVLADAIKAGAQVIVTFDKRDFSHEALEEFDIEAQHPDDLFSTRKKSGVWSQSRLDGFAVASVAELSPLTSRQKRFACSSESFALRCEVGATVDDGTHGKRHPQIHDARPGVQFGRLVTGFEKERLSL
jgi:hypothetical protein